MAADVLLYTAGALISLGVALVGLSLPTVGAVLSGVWPLNEFFDESDRPGLRVIGAGFAVVGLLAGGASTLV
jgi:hypothetical protein